VNIPIVVVVASDDGSKTQSGCFVFISATLLVHGHVSRQWRGLRRRGLRVQSGIIICSKERRHGALVGLDLRFGTRVATAKADATSKADAKASDTFSKHVFFHVHHFQKGVPHRNVPGLLVASNEVILVQEIESGSGKLRELRLPREIDRDRHFPRCSQNGAGDGCVGNIFVYAILVVVVVVAVLLLMLLLPLLLQHPPPIVRFQLFQRQQLGVTGLCAKEHRGDTDILAKPPYGQVRIGAPKLAIVPINVPGKPAGDVVSLFVGSDGGGGGYDSIAALRCCCCCGWFRKIRVRVRASAASFRQYPQSGTLAPVVVRNPPVSQKAFDNLFYRQVLAFCARRRRRRRGFQGHERTQVSVRGIRTVRSNQNEPHHSLDPVQNVPKASPEKGALDALLRVLVPVFQRVEVPLLGGVQIEIEIDILAVVVVVADTYAASAASAANVDPPVADDSNNAAVCVLFFPMMIIIGWFVERCEAHDLVASSWSTTDTTRNIRTICSSEGGGSAMEDASSFHGG